MRSFLMMILVLGVLSSLLSRGPSHGNQSSDQTFVNATSSDGANFSTSTSSAPAPMDGSIELQRNEDGHFYADVEINGAQVHMLVDTGASGIALSREDARKAGIATSIGMNEVVGQGADGSVHGEFVTVDRMTLGGKTVQGMRAIVLNGGEQSLLGETFLKEFASVEIHGNTMTLR